MKFVKESIRWSGVGSYPLWRSVGASAGMALPLILGMVWGNPGFGVTVAFGSFAISNKIEAITIRRQLYIFLEETIVFGIAGYTGMRIGNIGIESILSLCCIAFVAGLVGGISRTMVKLTTQFIIVMIIATHMDPVHPLIGMVSIMSGAAYTATVCITARILSEKFRILQKYGAVIEIAEQKRYTNKQLLYAWRKKLYHFQGWLYAIRLGLSLLAAGIVIQVWPMHYGYWVLLTVAIVLHRNPQMILQKAFQRMTGTVAAVLFAELWLILCPPLLVSICLVGVVAFFRPLLNAGNYMAYAASTSLLIILLFSLNRVSVKDLFFDRMVSTLIGCVLSLVIGYIAWLKWLPKQEVPKQSVQTS